MAFDVGLYLYLRHRLPHDPRFLGLAGFDPLATARTAALEFLAGYVVEYSLSVDNIFVFVVVLAYFAVPAHLQHRVLFFGILGALIFRAIFIALGAALLGYNWVTWLFGGFLVVTGVRMMFAKDKGVEPEENAMIRLFRRMVPVTAEMQGKSFVVRVFVGLKMMWLNRAFGGHFPILPSLAIIVGVIASSIILSLLFPKAPEEGR